MERTEIKDLEGMVNSLSTAFSTDEHSGKELALAQVAVSIAIFKALTCIYRDMATWKNQ